MTLAAPRDCADAERFARAIAAIDAANAADPATILVNGEPRPKELTHAALLCDWVARLAPSAGEALLLAARAHHIRRWTVPRASYPPGREHYLRWRRDLRRFHADEAARILRAEGYDEPLVDRVRQIVRKEALFSDPEVQTLEDGLNLVFLQTQFDEFRERLGDDERLVAIVRRTWRKMSARGREAALGLDLSDRGRALVARALEGGDE